MGLGRVKTFWPRETGDAKLNLACCRELESTWLGRSSVSDLVAPVRTPHVWIAAMEGLDAEDVWVGNGLESLTDSSRPLRRPVTNCIDEPANCLFDIAAA